jgi:hypothetical protein
MDIFGFGDETIQTGCAVVVPAGRDTTPVPGGY